MKGRKLWKAWKFNLDIPRQRGAFDDPINTILNVDDNWPDNVLTTRVCGVNNSIVCPIAIARRDDSISWRNSGEDISQYWIVGSE